MSGPVSTTDAPPAVAGCSHPSAPCVEVMEGAVGIDGQPLPPGKLGYLGQGRDQLHLDVREPTRCCAARPGAVAPYWQQNQGPQ